MNEENIYDKKPQIEIKHSSSLPVKNAMSFIFDLYFQYQCGTENLKNFIKNVNLLNTH